MSETTYSEQVTGDGASRVGFGVGEVAYLLSRYQGAQVERTIEVMGLNPAPSDELLAAGASSLLARGMLEVVEDRVDLLGPAQVAAYAMAAAEHWTQVGLMVDADNAADGMLILQAGEVTALLYPRALGTWYLMLKNPQMTTADSVYELAESFVSEQSAGAIFLDAQTLTWKATLFVRRLPDGSWEQAKGAAPFWEEAGVERCTRDEVRDSLATILSVPERTSR